MKKLIGFVVGYALWCATEYSLHRWAMHGTWVDTDNYRSLKQNRLAKEHRAHHRDPLGTVDPVRRERMALLAGAMVADRSRILVGWLTGLNVYTLLHYKIHTSEPRWALTKKIWANHLFHHRRPRHSFGVTTPV